MSEPILPTSPQEDAGARQPSAPEASAPSSLDLVVVCGGLGFDQTEEIARVLETNAPPNRHVHRVGSSNSYKHLDLRSILAVFPADRLTLVLHSFACQAGLQQISGLSIRSRLVILDPVASVPLWGDIRFDTRSVADALWLEAESGFPVCRASLLDLTGIPWIHDKIVIPGTTHNSLCHSKETLRCLAAFL